VIAIVEMAERFSVRWPAFASSLGLADRSVFPSIMVQQSSSQISFNNLSPMVQTQVPAVLMANLVHWVEVNKLPPD